MLEDNSEKGRRLERTSIGRDGRTLLGDDSDRTLMEDGVVDGRVFEGGRRLEMASIGFGCSCWKIIQMQLLEDNSDAVAGRGSEVAGR